MSDIKVTTAGAPSLEVGGVSYPLAYTVLGMKRYAELAGVSFQEALRDGFELAEMTEDKLEGLLLIALQDGERRRHLEAGGEGREITTELVRGIIERFHVLEVWPAVLEAWMQPAGRSVGADPQTEETASPGALSSTPLTTPSTSDSPTSQS